MRCLDASQARAFATSLVVEEGIENFDASSTAHPDAVTTLMGNAVRLRDGLPKKLSRRPGSGAAWETVHNTCAPDRSGRRTCGSGW